MTDSNYDVVREKRAQHVVPCKMRQIQAFTKLFVCNRMAMFLIFISNWNAARVGIYQNHRNTRIPKAQMNCRSFVRM